MPQEIINLEKLIKKLSAVNINNWTTTLGFERGSYRTSLGDQFDVSLSVNYKDKYFNADDRDYTLLITPRLKFNPITFSGKDVRELYSLIESKYDEKAKVIEKSDTEEFINGLNLFLDVFLGDKN